MVASYRQLSDRRQIIDRRLVQAELDTALAGAAQENRRRIISATLMAAHKRGKAEIRRRIEADPGRGIEHPQAQSFLIDQLLRMAFDAASLHLYPLINPTAAERIALAATGGFGRAEMAPYSDVDITFLTPRRNTPWVEQIVEAVLYILWDLGLKAGYSTRTIEDTLRLAKTDLTVRTALLEARYLWGDRTLYDAAIQRFRLEVVAGHASEFVTEKLAERDERHRRMGDSRYVVEPNVKDGKGGLRDLQTLFWIGKFVHQVQDGEDLIERGLFTPAEYRLFVRARNFLWAVRVNLHDIAGRAEERLTFDMQQEIATRMAYASRPGMSPVERFMRHYFLIAKQVGNLTALFLAHLEEQHARQILQPRLRHRPARLNGFLLSNGQIEAPDDNFFRRDPVRLIELFQLAGAQSLDIHPMTLRQAARDARLIDQPLRDNARANTLFLEMLTAEQDPARMLRAMNEAGVLGRFIPDFGRVNARMQWDMYHHYTVDEHTIRAIGLLSRLEKGELKAELPLATAIVRQIVSRRALYVAVLLHDIAKGRGGDHSIIGAEIALELGPRFGLTAAETDTVSWLVRQHLLLSAVAFKRDLSDPQTIQDMARAIASTERLRLLLVLTSVDISAVGPGIWNDWKGRLLQTLYDATEEVLRLGHMRRMRQSRVQVAHDMLQQQTGASPDAIRAFATRLADSYWIAEPADVVLENFHLVQQADAEDPEARLPAVATKVSADGASTLVTVYAADQPGLFYRIAGAIALAGASVMDARIHTTMDGMALDNLIVQGPLGEAFAEPEQLERLRHSIESVIAEPRNLGRKLASRPLPRRRQEVFPVIPQIYVDNQASKRLTVIEITAQDRPALLYALTRALFDARITIHSAHIATYGERAVDTFYITGHDGEKITDATQLADLEQKLLQQAGNPEQIAAEPA